MNEYRLTEAQKYQWTKHIRLLFQGVKNDSQLAASIDLSTIGNPKAKTFASYIGEFRAGKARGLKHFFDSPKRLQILANALECNFTDFHNALSKCKRVSSIASKKDMFLPGCEDLGPMMVQRAFVLPPEEIELRDNIRTFWRGAKSSTPIFVIAKEAKGRSSVAAWMASLAEDEGWQVIWDPKEAPPTKRNTIWVIDHHQQSEDTIKEWLSEKRGLVLQTKRVTTLPHTKKPTYLDWNRDKKELTIHDITFSWTKTLELRIRDILEKTRGSVTKISEKKLRTLYDTTLYKTPESIGWHIRSLYDKKKPSTAWMDYTKQALIGMGNKDILDSIDSIEDIIEELHQLFVSHTQLDLQKNLDILLHTQIETLIDKLRMTKKERNLLNRMIPRVSSRQLIQSFEQARAIVAVQGGYRIRRRALMLSQHHINRSTLRKALINHDEIFISHALNNQKGKIIAFGLFQEFDAKTWVSIFYQQGIPTWLNQIQWNKTILSRMILTHFYLVPQVKEHWQKSKHNQFFTHISCLSQLREATDSISITISDIQREIEWWNQSILQSITLSHPQIKLLIQLAKGCSGDDFYDHQMWFFEHEQFEYEMMGQKFKKRYFACRELFEHWRESIEKDPQKCFWLLNPRYLVSRDLYQHCNKFGIGGSLHTDLLEHIPRLLKQDREKTAPRAHQ